MVQLGCKADFIWAMTDGQWKIFRRYMIVQSWHPFFKPYVGLPRFITVWIHCPNLPIFLYEEAFLEKVGNSLGKPIRVDENTGKIKRQVREIHGQDRHGEAPDPKNIH